MAPFEGTSAKMFGSPSPGDVIEISLLLPTSWAEALLDLSKRRRQSVGQLLRSLIDHALVDDRTSQN